MLSTDGEFFDYPGFKWLLLGGDGQSSDRFDGRVGEEA